MGGLFVWKYFKSIVLSLLIKWSETFILEVLPL